MLCCGSARPGRRSRALCLFKGMILLTGLMLEMDIARAQTGDLEFHYLFSPGSPEADAGPQNHTLVLGSQVETTEDAEAKSMKGFKVSPTLQGRVYFEDMNADGAAILRRLISSEWTLEFWIKLDELSERSQLLFAVQPAKKSHSDITIRLVPEPSSLNAGSINITDSTGFVLAKSPVIEWQPGVWYYLAIASAPTEGGRLFAFYRADRNAPHPDEIYSGSAKPIVPLEEEAPRLYNFANFWGNFGQDALRGTMGNIRLSWQSKNEREVSQSFQEATKQ